MSKTVEIIACPFNGGQPHKGVSKGPEYMLNAGLLDRLRALDLNVNFDDFQSFTPPQDDPPFQGENTEIKNPLYVSEANQLVANLVHQSITAGKLAVTLGGDHSLGIGTVSGSLRANGNTCVIWVDAHADINTVDTTFSGNMHGMPLSLLLGIGRRMPQFAWVNNLLTTDRLVYIGLRDVDSGEKEIIRNSNIKAFDMRAIDALGIEEVIRQALDYLKPSSNRPIHLSFDVDSIDPVWTPSTGTAVWGGATVREGHFICQRLAESGFLCAVDLVEVNPDLPLRMGSPIDQTVAVANSIVATMLGETLL